MPYLRRWALGAIILGILLTFVFVGLFGALPASGDDTPPPVTGGPTPSADGTEVRAVLPGGAPELASYKDKIIFMIDRSGSMGVGERYETALSILDELLLQMPPNTSFDVYLVTEKAVSVFGESWYKPSADQRKEIRKKILAAGGIDYGGFTDFVGAIRSVSDKRRPQAIYVLTDGVQTLHELDTDAIVAEVAKAEKSLHQPIHTIGIGLGLDPAEDGAEAALVLRGIAEATGGVHREVKCARRPVHRSFLLPPPWMPVPPEETVKFHIHIGGGRETFSRLVPTTKDGTGDVTIEVEDQAVSKGPVAIEYASPRMIVRTFFQSGKLFAESRPLTIQRVNDRFVNPNAVCFVPPSEESSPDEIDGRGAQELKVPEGGSIEFVWKRGAREFRECAMAGSVAAARRAAGNNK